MTAPSPAAAGLPAEDVERVARALADADGWTTNGTAWDVSTATERDSYRRLAAAALAEMRPTVAEEAVKRVDELSDALARERFLVPEIPRLAAAERIRAALAPVPDDADGGERR